MLVATGKVHLGEVTYASTQIFERSFRLYVEERRGTVWDTRFARTSERDSGARPVLVFLLQGWNAFHDRSWGDWGERSALLASQDVFEGCVPGSTRSAGGEPCRMLQLRLLDGPPLADGAPVRIMASTEVLAAAERVAAAALARGESAELREAVVDLLERCHAEGLVAADLARTIVEEESANLARIWRALRTAHLVVERFPALARLVSDTGLSLRQVSRDLDELGRTFHFGWVGWREAVRQLRLRWAVLLLSSEDVSVTEIATATGYSGATALGAALRDAGLPPPSEIRALIRERERALRGTG